MAEESPTTKHETIQVHLEYLRRDVGEIKEKMVTKTAMAAELATLKSNQINLQRIVYGLVAAILLGFLDKLIDFSWPGV